MQPLLQTTTGPVTEACAWDLMDATLPLVWFIRRRMRKHRKGLSVPQFRALVQVEQQPCASLSTVAEYLTVSLPTTSRIVAGLVNKGLIQRADCAKDRRQISLEITARGQSVLTAAWRGMQDELSHEIGEFTPEQCATVSQAMKILKSKFGSLVREGSDCSVDERAMCATPGNGNGEEKIPKKRNTRATLRALEVS
jgi:MarR family transcriptional regulator, 2-MHQ and catechol-resistance regulon repressor